jgi:hypothetical protein
MCVALGVVVAASAAISAQWPAIPDPTVPRDAQGKIKMDAPTPRTPDGKPDFSGLWMRANSGPPNEGRGRGRGPGGGAAGAPGAAGAGGGAAAAPPPKGRPLLHRADRRGAVATPVQRSRADVVASRSNRKPNASRTIRVVRRSRRSSKPAAT